MIRNTAYYSQQIAARYPDLPAKEIQKLCVLVMKRIYGHALRDNDIRIVSEPHKLVLKIYKPEYSSTEHNERVQLQANYRWTRRRILARIVNQKKKKTP